MASSSYWKRLMNQESAKITKYENWLDDLSEIKKGFSKRAVTNGPDDANKKINSTVKDLNNAVDGCTTYDTNVKEIERQKELDTDVDALVSGAEDAIANEIIRIEDKKETAEANYKYYRKKYRQALAAEAEAAKKEASS